MRAPGGHLHVSTAKLILPTAVIAGLLLLSWHQVENRSLARTTLTVRRSCSMRRRFVISVTSLTRGAGSSSTSWSVQGLQRASASLQAPPLQTDWTGQAPATWPHRDEGIDYNLSRSLWRLPRFGQLSQVCGWVKLQEPDADRDWDSLAAVLPAVWSASCLNASPIFGHLLTVL